MPKILKILCVVDPTTTVQPAVIRSQWLAKATGASLELLICHYDEYLSGDRLFDSPSLDKARTKAINDHKNYLEELAAPLRADGLVVETAAIWDRPLHDGIVRRAIAQSTDIVLKDTHHHAALSRALLTNTDWNLIRTCPMPLWLVKPGDIFDAPNFVAAIDPLNEHDKPAALDDEILVLSKYIAESVGAEVHAFHAFDPRIAVAAATANAYIPVSLPLDEMEAEEREKHQKRFEQITRFHNISDTHAHLIAGLTHEELPIIAKKLDASVVVMGAVARKRLKRLFIGATAERTLEHLPCDLLVVKPSWFHSPVDMHVESVA